MQLGTGNHFQRWGIRETKGMEGWKNLIEQKFDILIDFEFAIFKSPTVLKSTKLLQLMILITILKIFSIKTATLF